MAMARAEHRFPPPFTGEVVRRTGGGIVAALLLFGVPANAGWHDEAAPADVQRLAQLTESRNKGLEEAQAAGGSDLATIRSVLQSGTVAATPRALVGKWRCRTMKLGGLTPAVVYSWFNCRVSDKAGTLAFEKLTGSQRTSGTLYPDGEGFVYLGGSYVSGEKPHPYSGNRAGAGSETTPDDQIGRLMLLYDGRARLELPYPSRESTFDVIELKR